MNRYRRIQRTRIFYAVFTEPGNHFKIGNHGGARLVGDSGGIGDVVKMCVRHEDIVGLDFFDIHRFGEWVLGDKWVKQQVFSIDFGGKARVAVVSNFHAILFPFDLGNTGNKREHLVTITGNSSQTIR